MATVGNAFDLLRSAEQPSSKPKKKKANKPKAPAASDGAEAPAVAGESLVVAGGARGTDAAAAPAHQEIVELAEAVPILEKSARTQGPNRIKLWKDWMRQVRRGTSNRRASCCRAAGGWVSGANPFACRALLLLLSLQVNDRSPRALKYRAPDGSLINFKQVRGGCAEARNRRQQRRARTAGVSSVRPHAAHHLLLPSTTCSFQAPPAPSKHRLLLPNNTASPPLLSWGPTTHSWCCAAARWRSPLRAASPRP
jgi:hypothetical protein